MWLPPAQLTISATVFRLRNDLYCVEWDVKFYYTIPYLGLSVLDLGPIYATDRRQTKASLNTPPIRGGA